MEAFLPNIKKPDHSPLVRRVKHGAKASSINHGTNGHDALPFLSLQNKLFYFIFKETITDHRRTFSPGCARDLIDSFLEEMELRNKQTDSTFNGKANKK
jgi:hypothetical protein